MNRLLPLFLLLSVSLAYSQGLGRFRVGIGAGNIPVGTYRYGGMLYIEPAYRIQGNISVGIRLEGAAAILKGVGNMTFMSSYSVNTLYYFPAGKVRPFAGLGLGYYSFAANGSMCDCDQKMEPNVPGFYPRIGLEYGRLVFALEYDFIRDVKMTTRSIIPQPVNPGLQNETVSYLRANYFSVKFGFFVGGRRQKVVNSN